MTELFNTAPALVMYTIYHSPTDFPGRWVMRPWAAASGETLIAGPARLGDSIEEVRAHVPPGLIRFVRQPDDHPHIVETWI